MVAQTWAPRDFGSKTYHALRGGDVTLCGMKLSVSMLRLWEPEVPRRCRKCPRCVCKGA